MPHPRGGHCEPTVFTGYIISSEVGGYAVLAKILRVALLLPVVEAFVLALRKLQ